MRSAIMAAVVKSTDHTEYFYLLLLQTPAFGVTKTPYLDNGGKPADNPCGDAQTPCSVGNGNKFWWLIKATITAGEYTSFSFSDVMDPDIISAGVSTCSTSQGDKSGQLGGDSKSARLPLTSSCKTQSSC